MKKPGLNGQMHYLSNHKKHEKTRLNRADALFVELTCNDYILISQVNGQAAYTVACIWSASP
jgi:hypothetical protein